MREYGDDIGFDVYSTYEDTSRLISFLSQKTKANTPAYRLAA